MRSAQLFLLLLMATFGYAQDPMDRLIGTWELNTVKSKPATDNASTVMKIEKTGPSTVRVNIDRVTKSGEKNSLTFTRLCDGKEYHTEGLPPGITEICDPTALGVVSKRDSKTFSELQVSFSPDGKSHTVTVKSLNREGKSIERISV